MIADQDTSAASSQTPIAGFTAIPPSLLAAYLDGHQSPEQIAADHGLSVEALFDCYESELFQAAIGRRESLALARARAIIAAAYPDALQVLADTARDPDSPTYARRNSAHTITRIAHGAALPALRPPGPRAHSNRTATVRERTEPGDPPSHRDAPPEPLSSEHDSESSAVLRQNPGAQSLGSSDPELTAMASPGAPPHHSNGTATVRERTERGDAPSHPDAPPKPLSSEHGSESSAVLARATDTS